MSNVPFAAPFYAGRDSTACIRKILSAKCGTHTANGTGATEIGDTMQKSVNRRGLARPLAILTIAVVSRPVLCATSHPSTRPIALRADAPVNVRKLFEALIARRDGERLACKQAIETQTLLARDYKIAGIAPTLKLKESPRRDKSGKWFFNSLASRKLGIANAESELVGLTTRFATLNDDGYLPDPKQLATELEADPIHIQGWYAMGDDAVIQAATNRSKCKVTAGDIVNLPSRATVEASNDRDAMLVFSLPTSITVTFPDRGPAPDGQNIMPHPSPDYHFTKDVPTLRATVIGMGTGSVAGAEVKVPSGPYIATVLKGEIVFERASVENWLTH